VSRPRPSEELRADAERATAVQGQHFLKGITEEKEQVGLGGGASRVGSQSKGKHEPVCERERCLRKKEVEFLTLRSSVRQFRE
jgi:hypothetical protein